MPNKSKRASNKSTNINVEVYKPKYQNVGGGIYGLGFLGAAIYYISTATGFWMGVLGVLKALVWPAFLVFYLLKSVGA